MNSRSEPFGRFRASSSGPYVDRAKSIVVRLADSPDEGQLFHSVGSVVDELYPNGREKLMAKLFANIALRDNSFVASVDGDIVAYAAETRKADGSLKLSTFWVRTDARRSGVGRQLITFLVARWLSSRVTSVHVTVRLGHESELLALLSQYGFEHLAVAEDRYGPGLHEVVLGWNPNQYRLTASGSATRSRLES